MSIFFHMPVELYLEENAIQNHQEVFGRYGQRCLIVTGRHSAKACGALDDVTAALESQGIAWQLFDQVGQNPLLSVCHQGGQAAAAFGADFIVGIGGGSPLDAAKAVAVFGANPELAPMELYEGWQNQALPMVLVGTTAGTGSEVTCFSVLTVDENGQKRSWGNHQSFAKVTFGDWRYTASLPLDFTLSTGLDAVSHALESYYSKQRDEVSDLFAIQALQLLLPTLKAVWAGSDQPSPRQREALYRGSIYAGFALCRSGTTFCHLMGYYLTEQCGVPHGYACAAFLPALVTRSVPLMPRESQRLFAAIGMYAAELGDTIRMLTKTEFDPITDQQLEQLLTRWAGNKNMVRSPGELDTQEQREIAAQVLQRKG